jgi:hypothetical protein
VQRIWRLRRSSPRVTALKTPLCVVTTGPAADAAADGAGVAGEERARASAFERISTRSDVIRP